MKALPNDPMECEQRGFKSLVIRVLVACGVVGTGLAIWMSATGQRAGRANVEPVPVSGIKIPLLGYVRDFEFRPDGREIAVIQQFTGDQTFVATILTFPAGTLVRRLNNVASGVGAWNRDGSQFAVGRGDGYSLDVWDARSWIQQRTLSVGFSDKEKQSIGPVDFAAIGFDCLGNLYCAERVWAEFIPTAQRVKAWWAGATKAVGIAENERPYDLAIACMRDGTRLAIAFDRPRLAVEVWRIRQEPDGKREARREFQIPDLHQARVALTKDGAILVTQDESAIRIYRLFVDHITLTHTLDAQFTHLALLKHVKPVISSDGRLAAFVCARRIGSDSVEARVVVCDIADGDIVFESHRPANPVAFSPDSKLLAVCDSGTIVAYMVNNK